MSKKIVFVALSVESLAIEYLSSYLKKQGYEVEVVFDPQLFDSEVFHFKKISKIFDIKKELVQQIIEKKPDLIGFSVFTINYQRCLSIAKELKKQNKNIPIIFGGIHPTSVPEVVIKEKNVDLVCVGEGEDALSELLKSINNKKINTDIKNIWFKDKNGKIIKNSVRPLINDLNKLPFLDKDLFNNIYPKFMNDYYTISSRGCPFRCTYCANNVLQKVYQGLGKSIRQRSPENLIEELIVAKKRYSVKHITFADDVFVQDLVWLKKFTKLYKRKINLPYTMLTHPSFISQEVANLLAKSGCFLLAFGIQSASEKTRTQILNRHETNNQILKAAKHCHQANLKFSIDHIFNIPSETIKEQEEALKFYNEIRPSVINSYWLQYFPKTEIIQSAIKYKKIKKEDVVKIENGYASSSFVVGFGAKDIYNQNLDFANFQFFFMLLPILPKSIMNFIITKKYYLTSFKPPIFLNILIKFFINLSQKRGYVYLDMIRNIFHFTFQNIFLKIKFYQK